ncbi:Maf family protein [Kaistella jeonii]|uniref:dTTP/UTP pyrophosphatase n=1 Tax=Kaistella jeonii TaxID=266749 RepID=A0A0C1FEB0_9FLAO|nr:Maf family nucleotide pyrophosphatase [Kaistella jeonii]KIA90128.1 septum formation inhibitor Maf [Kaistella jeonii]SFB77331.1 septum formation protein [Kaistella jeonii]VEI96410.1 Septum formation protein Maf [Kaistella jeonii]
MKLLLASNSPRRKELLQNLGFTFEVVSIDCEEIYPENLEVEEIAEYLSELKANAFRGLEKDEILITADTIVALENEILGKPKDEAEARKMLRKLSGKTHQVYTGFTIRSLEKNISKTDVASVEIDELTDFEIDFYIKNYKPFDKAGSYGVQEWLGMAKIKKIEGSYYTIMGFPTHLVYSVLKDFE